MWSKFAISEAFRFDTLLRVGNTFQQTIRHGNKFSRFLMYFPVKEVKKHRVLHWMVEKWDGNYFHSELNINLKIKCNFSILS